jgi:TonB family protein
VHALEDEPESGDRWRRLGMGALISALVLFLLGYGAQRFEPTRRLIQKVVEMTVVTELPKIEKLPPPRTEPPPPPPKRATPPKSAAKTAAPPKADNPQPQTSEPLVGLDDGSFGSGDGASFQVGNTQLGEPVSVARAPAAPLVAPVAKAPPKVIPGGIPERAERCKYSQRAQKRGVQGLMVVEVDIDEQGRVTDADVRQALDTEIDQECLEGIRTARFEPATLAGQPVAYTRFVRIRFELDR